LGHFAPTARRHAVGVISLAAFEGGPHPLSQQIRDKTELGKRKCVLRECPIMMRFVYLDAVEMPGSGNYVAGGGGVRHQAP